MSNADLDVLPALFTHRAAIEAGISKRRLYALRDAGLVESVARGIFRRTDSDELFDLDLAEAVLRMPDATLCLTSALVRHDLTDQNPIAIDLAIPAGSHRPIFGIPIKLHLFDRKTFDIGRTLLPIGAGLSIGIYSAERCIVDAFRLSWAEGDDLAYIALRRWLGRRESKPEALYAMAGNFPSSLPKILRAADPALSDEVVGASWDPVPRSWNAGGLLQPTGSKSLRVPPPAVIEGGWLCNRILGTGSDPAEPVPDTATVRDDAVRTG